MCGEGGMGGKGGMCRGKRCAWQGTCIAEGMHGRGMAGGGACGGRGVCVAGETATAADDMKVAEFPKLALKTWCIT